MIKNISTILCNAPAEKVWDALTDPAKVKVWQFGSDLYTNWEPGTGIEFITAWEGKIFKQWGKVLEIRPNEFIKYSLFAPRPGLEDKPENYFIMDYVLTPEGGKTKLEIIQEDNRPNAVQEAPQGDENPVLASLKKLIETT